MILACLLSPNMGKPVKTLIRRMPDQYQQSVYIKKEKNYGESHLNCQASGQTHFLDKICFANGDFLVFGVAIRFGYNVISK